MFFNIDIILHAPHAKFTFHNYSQALLLPVYRSNNFIHLVLRRLPFELGLVTFVLILEDSWQTDFQQEFLETDLTRCGTWPLVPRNK